MEYVVVCDPGDLAHIDHDDNYGFYYEFVEFLVDV